MGNIDLSIRPSTRPGQSRQQMRQCQTSNYGYQDKNELKSGHKSFFFLLLKCNGRFGLRLLESNQDKINGRVTSVAGFVPYAKVDGVYPAH